MSKIKIVPADKYFSLWIRNRDNWTCQRCFTAYTPPTNALHCSHFKGRGKQGTRFEPLNADALCYGCHQYFTSQPDEHYAWQLERKGQDTIDKLILAANSYHKKQYDLEKIYWRNKLKDDFGI